MRESEILKTSSPFLPTTTLYSINNYFTFSSPLQQKYGPRITRRLVMAGQSHAPGAERLSRIVTCLLPELIDMESNTNVQQRPNSVIGRGRRRREVGRVETPSRIETPPMCLDLPRSSTHFLPIQAEVSERYAAVE